jgi:glycolate oxidase iron-sulfur subunit
VRRGPASDLARAALRAVVPRTVVFEALVNTGQLMRPLLPLALRAKVPPAARPARPMPERTHARRMLVLRGCVQPALSPATNVAAARVLDRLGITLEAAQGAGCCGGVSFHLTAEEEARGYMRRNVDAWWPHVEAGVEAIVIAASGCGVMVKDYGHHLARDPAYAEKAARISALTKDISEVIVERADDLKTLIPRASALAPRKVAFHAPCTLQHGLKIRGEVERLLLALGVDLVPVRDAHLCCGSAGTYSVLHPELAGRLRDNKIAALTAGEPAEIVTANIGCQTHLQGATERPVRHWIELVDDLLTPD